MPADHRVGHPVVADREVVNGALGLGAPVVLGGDFDPAHAVGFGARAHVPNVPLCFAHLAYRAVHRDAEVRAQHARRSCERGGLEIGGDDDPVALDAAHDRLRHGVDLAGLDRFGDAGRLRRLEHVLALEPWGLRVGRVRAGHDDPVGRELDAERLGQPAHRVLRGRVGAVAEHADQRGHGTDQHEVPALALDHRRHDRADRVQGAEVVDLHLVAEDRLVELLEVPGMGGVGGRGHEDVARPEALGEAVDGRLQRGAIAHVGAGHPDHARRPFGRLRCARPRRRRPARPRRDGPRRGRRATPEHLVPPGSARWRARCRSIPRSRWRACPSIASRPDRATIPSLGTVPGVPRRAILLLTTVALVLAGTVPTVGPSAGAAVARSLPCAGQRGAGGGDRRREGCHRPARVGQPGRRRAAGRPPGRHPVP